MIELLERVGVLVVGAGQAGLAAAWHLDRAGVDYIVIDAGVRIGDSWRQRWDSLTLFTPASANALPGFPMRGTGRRPTKDDAADHLVWYARDSGLRVALNSPVTRLQVHAAGFRAAVGDRTIAADRVVDAGGSHRVARIPDFASTLPTEVAQLTSAEYRNPAAGPVGRVLVVGAGNSGAEIAIDLAHGGGEVLPAGRDVGRIPPVGTAAFALMRHVRAESIIGRRFIARTGGGGDPLGRVRPRDFERAAITRIGRVAWLDRTGRPLTVEGPVEGIATVVWCTGLAPDRSWLAPGSATTPPRCSRPAPSVPLHVHDPRVDDLSRAHAGRRRRGRSRADDRPTSLRLDGLP
ncbi:NAD(P)-binding domain-containing protein [Pseudonocardia sp. WMMC193]|uniref:NAD(P)-binding domain-containing protein n=1 Tax=Pseudonocardia sp. WMMC193 TaxID=2911965 RepID=UPI001F2B6DE2|nr:NAD(P)-binding domain-containing protein [Pseudonocardia sp. WMMC193]MCF7552642.1 NAD(P)-binding domain-containing protein [Pseudonocardia sp. WMMC193]